MNRTDFIEKSALILGFILEAVAIVLLAVMLTSCKVKKQSESRLRERSEILLNVKTGEAVSDSTVNVIRANTVESVDMDIYAILKHLYFSDPDSSGRQHVTRAIIVDYSDKSKTVNRSEAVDSTSSLTSSFKTVEDKSKTINDIKTESKIKSETDWRGWGLGVVVVLILTAISAYAVFKFKK